jgi:UDP-3-O-[3-hydroxymyristoyl] glucosamine N-acyltransferase
VFWFHTVWPGHAARVDVDVRRADAPAGAVRLRDLPVIVGATVQRDGGFLDLAFASADVAGRLMFAERAPVLQRALAAGASSVIVPNALAELVPAHVGLIVSEHPRRTFATIHRHLATATDFYGLDQPTWIDPTARVHPSASVEAINVRIGARCIVGPLASICGRVELLDGAVIDAGAILGGSGFQSAHDDVGDDEMPHVGGVSIGSGARVFAGAVIARGVFRTTTVVGGRARVGNNAFVSHECRVGTGTHIGHGAVINGNVSIGDGCWIGPGAVIAHGLRVGDGARVSLGSTVIRDVAPDAHVTGAVAVEHWAMMRATASLERRDSSRRAR